MFSHKIADNYMLWYFASENQFSDNRIEGDGKSEVIFYMKPHVLPAFRWLHTK